SGAYIPAGRVELPQWSTGAEKLADLLMTAVWECEQAAIERGLDPKAVPVIVLLPPQERWGPWRDLANGILRALAERLGRPLAPGSCAIAEDRVGLLTAIDLARSCFSRGTRGCVVAAVDS